MNLARLAIANSRITVIAIFALIAVGISTFLSYPSAEDPTIQIRTASIEARFPGMSAERVEELIAIPIETAMREIAEIDASAFNWPVAKLKEGVSNGFVPLVFSPPDLQ